MGWEGRCELKKTIKEEWRDEKKRLETRETDGVYKEICRPQSQTASAQNQTTCITGSVKQHRQL